MFHGPLGSGDAARPWYGSPTVLERWIRVVYDGRELDEGFQVEVGSGIGWDGAEPQHSAV